MLHAAKSDAGPDLRVGVIGVGVMGSNHARVLAEMPGVRLAGVCRSRPQAGRVRRHHARMPGRERRRGIARPRRRCGDDRGTHPSASRRSRSLASSAACTFWSRSRSPPPSPRASDIIAAARRAGVTLMIGHVERFNPAVQAIKEAIRNEDILSIAITRVGPFPPRMSNVGVVIDLAVHDIDLIRWFTGSEIVEVQPQLSNAVAEREDIALLQFRTASGVLAHINTNWLTPFKARTVHVATKRKYVIGDLLTRQVTECFGFQPDGSYSMRHLSVGHAEPLRAELMAFVKAIRASVRRRRSPARTASRALRSRSAASKAARCERPREPAPRCRLTSRSIRSSIEVMNEQPAGLDADPVHRRCRAASPARQQDRRRDRARARSLPIHSRARRCGRSSRQLAEFCGARHVVSCASGTERCAGVDG